MRHAKKRYQLNRITSWRKATILSLARSVLIYQSIKTTRTRAKAVRPLLEKLIGLARKDTLTAKRRAYQILGDHKLVSLLFSDIGKRFANRDSGYIRIIGFGPRRGDNADLVILELVEIKKKEKRHPKKDKEAESEIAKEAQAGVSGEAASVEEKTRTDTAVKEKPPITKKPAKKFLGGLKSIFKKERDSL